MNECPMCEGHGITLGYLGELFWLRCIQCGWEFVGEHEEEYEEE